MPPTEAPVETLRREADQLVFLAGIGGDVSPTPTGQTVPATSGSSSEATSWPRQHSGCSPQIVMSGFNADFQGMFRSNGAEDSRRLACHSLSSSPVSTDTIYQRTGPELSLAMPTLQHRRSSEVSCTISLSSSSFDELFETGSKKRQFIGDQGPSVIPEEANGSADDERRVRARGSKRRRALTDCSDDEDSELDGLPFLFLSQYRRQCVGQALQT
mmetsp:Transcript_29226/g.82465  ORF Transcript_29226/g.82465 Transcript_29226/m.82465 type:complete len:215 (-) Transcript_29226:65-709(-)